MLNCLRWFGLVLLTCFAAALLVISSYVLLLGWTWITDRNQLLVEPVSGRSDFSHLQNVNPSRVIKPSGATASAIQELQQLVRKAAAEQAPITIAGSRHSMGGHTLLNGSLAVDMRCDAFRHIDPVVLQNSVATVHVGAGATWHELLAALDREGWSVAVMQSNDDFTIGGSMSVNCHGWQPNSPPLESTVERFRILLADGSLKECSRDRPEDRDLFGAVCGGYGLFGIVTDVDLRVVPNALYRAEEFPSTSATFSQDFHAIVGQPGRAIGLAYGRVSIAPGHWFLRDARIIRFASADLPDISVNHTLSSFAPRPWEISLARLVFCASADSDFGKIGRWSIERFYGQTHHVVSRNGILRTPSEWFANRDPRFTEILHEYFVPPTELATFLDRIRPILRKDADVDLLNVTLRSVSRDARTILAYAPQEEIGLVMLFRYPATTTADSKMQRITQQLIDAALACDGSYYLPYRPHARVDQFQQAYPRYREFYELKRRYDPDEIFQNSFYHDYLQSALK